eukprot:35425-Eustigmatos_ZCMA.PRE.1
MITLHHVTVATHICDVPNCGPQALGEPGRRQHPCQGLPAWPALATPQGGHTSRKASMARGR